MRYVIVVRGVKSSVSPHPGDTLMDSVASAVDPNCERNLAYMEGRWDGIVRQWETAGGAASFFTGLVEAVSDALVASGHEVHVVDKTVWEVGDIDYLHASLLKGIELRGYQMEAARALLLRRNGIVQSPTGSGKAAMIAAVGRYLWDQFQQRTLVVVPRKGLADQTRRAFMRFYDGDIRVGMFADSQRIPGDVMVATASTLLSAFPREKKGRILAVDREVRDVLRNYECLFYDECHHSSATSWFAAGVYSQAVRRYGTSGTPIKHADLADNKMIAITGPVVCVVPAVDLIDAGILARPRIVMVCSENASGPSVDFGHGGWKDKYQAAIMTNRYHNRSVIRAVLWLADRERKVLLLCRRKAHWKLLKKALDDSGIAYQALWGATDLWTRNNAKEALDNGAIRVLLASTIFDEGEDVPGIDALVLAEGVKVNVNAIQRVGRALRRKPGENSAWVVDFAPTSSRRLLEHALARCEAWEGEGYSVELLEKWPRFNEDTPHDLLPFDTEVAHA